MPEHKIHRKELKKKLKEDEVAVFVTDVRESVSQYVGRYGRLTFWSVLAVVLVVSFVMLWRWKRIADLTNAQEIYTAAISQITYPHQDFAAAQNTLTELIERFSNQECLPAALALRGYCRHKTQDYAGALSDYQAALNRVADQPTKHSLRVSIAQCHRSLGQTDQAVEELESLRAESPAGVMRDQITYLVAQCKEDLNQPDQALALYNEISDGSMYKIMARERIAWLEAQPIPPLNQVG
jgi:tetratricopeptide (TPR) repeat protein